MIITFVLDDLYTGIPWRCCGAGVITQHINCITLGLLIFTWVFSMALCKKNYLCGDVLYDMLDVSIPASSPVR
jgi:hypothetical protein